MSIKKVSPESLCKQIEKQEDILLLDVRTEEKYQSYHISSSKIDCLNLPKEHLFNLEKEQKSTIPLDKDKEIVVVCTTGNSALKCAKILSQLGHRVEVLNGGINAWREFLNE